MVDRANPIRLPDWTPLRVRDRDHRDGRKSRKHRLVFRQIEPAVQRCYEWRRLTKKQREWIIVQMEMEEVELLIVAFLPDAFQHHHVKRIGVTDRSVEAQCSRPRRVKLAGGARIAAGKKRDLVPECDEFLGQPVYHPLGSAIKLGWNRLRQRSYLRDAHLRLSCRS